MVACCVKYIRKSYRYVFSEQNNLFQKIIQTEIKMRSILYFITAEEYNLTPRGISTLNPVRNLR